MVLRAIPVAALTAAIPPRPALRASAAAKRRRPRSSNTGFSASYRSLMAATSITTQIYKASLQKGILPTANFRFSNLSTVPKLIALACGPAPAGYARWTLSLLEEKVVELKIVEKASDNTIGRTLYPVHARTRKSFGLMTRKLSLTESQNSGQRLGTFLRRKSSVASANSRYVA